MKKTKKSSQTRHNQLYHALSKLAVRIDMDLKELKGYLLARVKAPAGTVIAALKSVGLLIEIDGVYNSVADPADPSHVNAATRALTLYQKYEKVNGLLSAACLNEFNEVRDTFKKTTPPEYTLPIDRPHQLEIQEPDCSSELQRIADLGMMNKELQAQIDSNNKDVEIDVKVIYRLIERGIVSNHQATSIKNELVEEMKYLKAKVKVEYKPY